MELRIQLPDRQEQLARNRKRWVEICADSFLASLPHRIESNAFGDILMSPPPGKFHGRLAYAIARKMEELLPAGIIAVECPVNTTDGVRAADVAWMTEERDESLDNELVYELAPEICVEVLSPSNTVDEMRHKRALYFDAGAEECWMCDRDGQMTFFSQSNPVTPLAHSLLCPAFPSLIQVKGIGA